MGKGTKTGVAQLKNFDPYAEVPGATMATMGGISTAAADAVTKQYGSGTMTVTGIDDGDWILVSKVDFADGAKAFTADFTMEEGGEGAVCVRLDNLNGGTDVAILPAAAGKQTVALEGVSGVHDVYFLFAGKGYCFNSWKFEK